MERSIARRLSTAALGAMTLLGGLLVAAPPVQASGEAFTVTVSVVGDSQIQFHICFTEGTSLPARVTGTYSVVGGGANHSGTWWSTDPDLILIGTEPCPASIVTVAVDGLQMSTTYAVSASIVADPVMEDDEGNFVADNTGRTAVSLSSSTSATTTNGTSPPGPDAPCEEDCEPAGDGGTSGGGTSGGGTSGDGGTSGGGTSGGGTSGGGTSGGGTSGGGTTTSIPNPQGFRPGQMEALSPAEVAGIRPAAFSLIPVASFRAISPAQARQITPGQAAVIGPERARAMTPSAVAALSPAAVAQLRPASVARFTPRQFAAMTTAQLRALTPRQIVALTPQQLAALTPAERALLRRR